MTGFLGEFEATLDAKGRFLLPAGFKRQVAGDELHRFVINRGFEKCLALYTLREWEPLFEKIKGLNEFDPKQREFRRAFLNGATFVEPDTAGRILLPPNLKAYAELGKDIIIASSGNKMESGIVISTKRSLTLFLRMLSVSWEETSWEAEQ